MLWAKLLILALPLVRLGVALARHGQTRTVTEKAWEDAIIVIMAYTVYYFAGVMDGIVT